MKVLWRFLALVALALALLAPLALARPAYAGHCAGDKQVFGGNYTLTAGQTLDSNLIILGGNASLEPGAIVNCTVVVIGGNADIAGAISEDLVIFGGNTTLRATAVITGELQSIGGTVTREAGAVVVEGEGQIFDFDRPRWFNFDTGLPFIDPVLWWYQNAIQTFLVAVVVGLIALAVVLFWPEQTTRVAAAITNAPAQAGGLGLLTAVAVPVLLALVTVTVCLIPVAFVGLVVFVAALLLGLIALGQIVGARLSAALRLYSITPPVATALGATLLWLVASAIGSVWCVGWIIWLLIASLGLGAVALTRFGTQPYLPGSAAYPPAAPPAPPAYPPEPSEPAPAA
jgi:hypothetical protein